MVGIREVHVEKQIPDRKKYTFKKNRCLSLTSIFKFWRKYHC